MRKQMLLAVMLVFVAAIAWSAETSQPKTDKVKAAVLKAIDDYWKAYESKDLDKAMAMTAPGFFGYGTGKDEKAVGIEQLKQSMARDFTQAKSISVQRTLAGFGRSGAIAWTAHEVIFKVQTDKGDVRMEGRLSMVLQKKGGKWLVEHTHFSAPLAEQQEGQSYPAAAK